LLPTEVEGFDSLAEPTLDLRWSWNHSADEVWRQLDVSTAACTGFADRSRLFSMEFMLSEALHIYKGALLDGDGQ
jgi:hypothetical protein